MAQNPTLTNPAPGSRMLIYKQDPAVKEIGIRKVYLHLHIEDGPCDTLLRSEGLGSVLKDANGDFFQEQDTWQFDAVQAYTVARMTISMVERTLKAAGVARPLKWQWNSDTNADPLRIFAHGPDNTSGSIGALYLREDRALYFGFGTRQLNPPNYIYTCRSLDFVAHETGHAILDALQPGWLKSSREANGIHESFGDLTAIFLTLSCMDMVEQVIAVTRADLHDKNFLANLGDEYSALDTGRLGRRNADNNMAIAVANPGANTISRVFTGAIYNVLASVFAFERKPDEVDDACTLYDVAKYLYGLLLRAIIAAPANNVTMVDIVNEMMAMAAQDGKPDDYTKIIRDEFINRGVGLLPLVPVDAAAAPLRLVAIDRDHEAGIHFDGTDECCHTVRVGQFYPNLPI